MPPTSPRAKVVQGQGTERILVKDHGDGMVRVTSQVMLANNRRSEVFVDLNVKQAQELTHALSEWIVVRNLSTSLFGTPYAVVDTKVQPGQKVKVLKRFQTEEAASQYIETLPQYLIGRYSIEGPEK